MLWDGAHRPISTCDQVQYKPLQLFWHLSGLLMSLVSLCDNHEISSVGWLFLSIPNLIPRVFRPLSQWWSPGQTLGYGNFYRRNPAVTGSQLVTVNSDEQPIMFFSITPEALLATTYWPRILRTLGTRLEHIKIQNLEKLQGGVLLTKQLDLHWFTLITSIMMASDDCFI